MVLPRIGYLIAAFATLTWFLGFATLEYSMYGLSCVLLATGFALTAFGKTRVGMTINGAVFAYWTIGFAIQSFGIPSTLAAAVLAGGAAAIAWAPPRYLVYGLGALMVGNLWYLVDNTFLTPFLGFAFGNWVFAIGMGLVLTANLRLEFGTTTPANTS